MVGKPGELGPCRRDVPGRQQVILQRNTARGGAERPRSLLSVANCRQRRTPRVAIIARHEAPEMDAISPTLEHGRPLDQAGRSAGRVADHAAWAVLGALAALAALTFRSYGLGWDDYAHSQYGDLLLSLY